MRATWIILILAAGCFADANDVQGGTDDTGSESGGDSGSDGASVSSTTAGTSTSGASTTATASTSSAGSDDESSSSAESSGSDGGSDSTGASGLASYEPCASDDECASGLCLMADAAEGGYCTATCEAHDECEGFPNFGALTISCAGSFGPNGEPVCLLNCPEADECPEGTACGAHDYNGESYGGLCG